MATDSCAFVLDDFLAPEALAGVKAEVVALREQFQYDDRNPEYVKYRIELDSHFGADRERSVILRTFDRELFSPRIVDGAQARLHDFTTRSLPFTTTHMTVVTAHVPDGPCTWHVNDMTHHLPRKILFTLNFICYLDFGGAYAGGNLLVSHDNVPQRERGGWHPATPPRVHEIIEPRENRLVLLPTSHWHMVEPIRCSAWRGPLDGRVSVNGHIGFRLA